MSMIQRNGRGSLAVPATTTPSAGGPRRASAPSAPIDPASLAAHAKAGWYRRTVHKEADADLDLLTLFVSEGHDPSDAGRMLRLNENDEHLSRLALEHVAHVKKGDKFKPLYCPVCDGREVEAAAIRAKAARVVHGGNSAAPMAAVAGVAVVGIGL
ncbi:uncharacterized protein LOC62_07G009800 [Vanrija pseudolonga]|uniref:Uncharacterized protein n=1 Tax=Vanrija pseudolonga TaxID=143232 RepID=A0AAF0YH44_9TREE|nr:hypothetical protein LOC62_07G009800 [Vanrija pseudolonga]